MSNGGEVGEVVRAFLSFEFFDLNGDESAPNVGAEVRRNSRPNQRLQLFLRTRKDEFMVIDAGALWFETV